MHISIKTKQRLSICASIVWFGFIVFASGAPQKTQDSIGVMYYVRMIPYYDKIIHCGLYSVFSFLLYASFWFSAQRRMVAFKALSTAIAVGIGMECMQYYVFIGRSADLIDALANSLGALLGVLSYTTVKRYWMCLK